MKGRPLLVVFLIVFLDLVGAGISPIGLGARDTLRLEAGMNLYGQDMDETVSPLDAGLAWTVAMKDERDFVGKTALTAAGQQKQFLGLILLDKGVLRGHQKVMTKQGDGEITSGSFSSFASIFFASVSSRAVAFFRSATNASVSLR